MKNSSILAAAILASAAQAQSPLYGQCKMQNLNDVRRYTDTALGGGTDWKGATTCGTGAYCSKVNDCMLTVILVVQYV
jgi:cellulose 1,4-beta-cellobiosidase